MSEIPEPTDKDWKAWRFVKSNLEHGAQSDSIERCLAALEKRIAAAQEAWLIIDDNDCWLKIEIEEPSREDEYPGGLPGLWHSQRVRILVEPKEETP